MSKSTLPGLVLLAFLVLLAVFALTAAQPARAETFHHCTTFIDAVPATISTPGSYCMRADLSSSLASGNLITINASNVRLDCNGFRLNGAGAAQPYGATGIRTTNRSNVTIRNCHTIGFATGMNLSGGSNYLVEDSRADGARSAGIWVDGEQSIVRRNRISDIGVGATGGSVLGIVAQLDGTLVEENTVGEIIGLPVSGEVSGILVNGDATVVRNNRVNTIVPGGGDSYGIHSNVGYRGVVEGNTVLNASPTTGYGIATPGGAAGCVCARNYVVGFTTDTYAGCLDGGDNYGY